MPRDHYAVLGVSRDATEDEIKKAYKKMALQWHPDKNMNNKTVAAQKFHEISDSYVTLSDPDKRKYYDQYGDDAPRRGGGGGGGGGAHARNGVSPEDLTPEDVFNMFFGIPPGARQQRRHYHYAQPGQNQQRGGAARAEASGFAFVQVLPVIALVVMSLLSSIDIDAAPYQLKPSPAYRIERETEGLGVKFFVPETFDLDYAHSGTSLRRIEEAVEQETTRTLAKQCGFERQQQQRMFDNAQQYGGPTKEGMLARAHEFPLSACDEEKRIRGGRR